MPFAPRGRTAGSPDWLWGGLGVAIAGASASFAAYMIIKAPGVGPGSPDFGVFAHFDRRTPRAVATATAANSTSPARALVAAAAPPPDADPGIDREPTGSINTGPAAQGVRVSSVARTARDTHLRDFVVRDVFGNRALIEHGQKLTLVRPGSILDGAGEVLSIERRGDSWVVRTAAGVIGGL